MYIGFRLLGFRVCRGFRVLAYVGVRFQGLGCRVFELRP